MNDAEIESTLWARATIAHKYHFARSDTPLHLSDSDDSDSNSGVSPPPPYEPEPPTYQANPASQPSSSSRSSHQVRPPPDQAQRSPTQLRSPPLASAHPSPPRTEEAQQDSTYNVTFNLQTRIGGGPHDEFVQEASNSITYTFRLPPGIYSHTRYPARCTARDCPIKNFHYQGYYVSLGQPVGRSRSFGDSDPPPLVWLAWLALDPDPRSVLSEQPGDLEMLQGFVRNHYWLLNDDNPLRLRDHVDENTRNRRRDELGDQEHHQGNERDLEMNSLVLTMARFHFSD